MAFIVHVLLILVTGLAHPFHVSVCDIEFNAATHSLEISQRMFLDDLEEALRKESGWTTLDVTNPSDKKRFDSLMKEYVTARVSLRVNEAEVTLKYLGHEIEADAMWCYLEVAGVNNLEEIEVANSVLIEAFPDQVNIVHIKKDKTIRSLKLYRNNETDRITY